MAASVQPTPRGQVCGSTVELIWRVHPRAALVRGARHPGSDVTTKSSDVTTKT